MIDQPPTHETALLARSVLPTGSESYEAVLYYGRRGNAGPPHGAPERWDWGMTEYSLAIAQQKHARLVSYVRELTPEQRDALWLSDTPEAAAARAVMPWVKR